MCISTGHNTMLQAACSTALFAYLRCLKFTINNIKQGSIFTVYGNMVIDTEGTALTLILRRSKPTISEKEYISLCSNPVKPCVKCGV